MGIPFIKVIPGNWDLGEPTAQLVKVSSNGLRGNDFREFVKRAGYQFADVVRNLDLKPGDVPAHQIIIGAGELYGSNRNGDTFNEDACRKYHDTFRKYAKCYRSHLNGKDDPHYGYIKESAYNEKMKRIELLAIYNGTKEAAARNGGELADEEIGAFEYGKEPSLSMSCKVPMDYCSSCGNAARNKTEYCKSAEEGGHCKDGGLHSNMGKVTGNDDYPILCAINKEPLFFDVSKVARGADRIAFAMGLNKSAAAKPMGGAALAELLGVRAPADLALEGESAELYKLACCMADIENNIKSASHLISAFTDSVQPKISWNDHDGQLGEVLCALVMNKIAMPVEGFLSMIGQRSVDLEKIASCVKEHLPGIYGRMIKSGELCHLLESNPFMPNKKLPPMTVRRWAEKRADYALDEKSVSERVMRGVIRSNGLLPPVASPSLVKSAAASFAPVEEIAKRYAIYRLSAVYSIDDEAVTKAAVVQHYS